MSSAALPEKTIEKLVVESAKRLGYEELKPLQKQAILGLLAGKDVFAVLPTGYGKSLCYACLPWIFETLNKSSKAI